MQAIRNALGSIGLGGAHGAPTATDSATGRLPYCAKIDLQCLKLHQVPEHLSRGKFEPYLCVRRNDEKTSAHRTSTKKDFSSATPTAPVVFNENYEIDCNVDDVLKVILFNDAPLLRPDQPLAEGIINIRDLCNAQMASTGTTGTSTTMPGSTGMGTGLICNRSFELPLYAIPDTHAATSSSTSGSGSHGALGGLKSLLPGRHHADNTTTTDSTTTAAAPVAPVTSTVAAGSVGTQLGIACLTINLIDSAHRTAATGTTNAAAVDQSTTTHTTATNTSMTAKTAAAATAAGGALGLAAGKLGLTGLGTNQAMKAGQSAFDVRIGQCSIDFPLLERLYGYKRADIESKLKPYFMIRNNSDATSSVKSNICPLTGGSASFGVDQVMRVFAAPGDMLYLYLLDDNLLTRDTYLGYCELPASLCSFSGAVPASSAAPMGTFQSFSLLAMDPKHNKTASIPSKDSGSLGTVGSIQVCAVPVDPKGTVASTGVVGEQSLTTAAGLQAHLKDVVPAQTTAAQLGSQGVAGKGAVDPSYQPIGAPAASTFGSSAATGIPQSGSTIPQNSTFGGSSVSSGMPPQSTYNEFQSSSTTAGSTGLAKPAPVASGQTFDSGSSSIASKMVTTGQVQSASDVGVSSQANQTFVDSGTVIGQGQQSDIRRV